jgi:hypothetical protein
MMIKRIARYLSVLAVYIIRKNRILAPMYGTKFGISFKGSVEKFNSVIGTNVKSIIGKVSKPDLISLFFGDSL